ncbi:MAG: AAA family ATPase [Desulfurellales bacterium]|nr:MAG: AAA family ATPase [Desulfurellales bacterium]
MTNFNTKHVTPSLWRDNMFDGVCKACSLPVLAGSGRAFIQWSEAKARDVWYACHADCVPAIMAGVVSSIAAKAVQEASTSEQELERLASLPAFQMPDVEAVEPMLSRLMDSMVTAIVQDVAAQFVETVPPMVEELLASARPVAITVGNMPEVTVTQKHKALEDVLLMVVADTQPFLVGPSGSGKTTLARQIATVLGRPFYIASRVSSEYKLTGFVDAHGKTVRTAFREAFEHGGVFLFDEVDASDADALTAFNAATACSSGETADFPDGAVARHADFVAIAAGNTFGRGADRQYVGRNQLDAATLDRFQVYEVDYDEQLELMIAGNDQWTGYVQKVRKAIDAEKVRHVVSPRASITGAKLLAAGMARPKVEEACIWKGLDNAQRARIMSRLNMGGDNA